MQTTTTNPIITFAEFIALPASEYSEGVSPQDLIPFLVEKHNVTFEEARELIYKLQSQGDFRLTPNYTIVYNAPNKSELIIN